MASREGTVVEARRRPEIGAAAAAAAARGPPRTREPVQPRAAEAEEAPGRRKHEAEARPVEAAEEAELARRAGRRRVAAGPAARLRP